MRALLEEFAGRSLDILTPVDLPPGPDPAEEGATFAENARAKALHYAGLHGMLCVADDSGLEVEVLGGRPGVRSARYAGEGAGDEENIARLLEELAPCAPPWKAAFVCHAAAALPGRLVAEAAGRIEGEIVRERRGAGGFGYDPVFLVTALGRTMAELSPEEKNRISHRGAALRRLAARLRELGLFGS